MLKDKMIKKIGKKVYPEEQRGRRPMLRRSGFALLYVMLFIFLILVTVVITWATSMAENRLNQRTEGGAEAYQLAQAALDDGWVKYHELIGNECDESGNVPSEALNYPSIGKVERFLVGEGSYANPKPDFGSGISQVDSLKGVYDFRISGTASYDRVIEGIGYYKGTKTTLKGKITNSGSILVIVNPPSCEINYSRDTILIYQTGPSGS